MKRPRGEEEPMTRKRLKGSVVVITGGTAGVGRAAARAFAKRGAKVAVLARGRQGLEATRRELAQGGAQAMAVAADVAQAEQVEAAAERIEQELGPIDIWVNNAMTAVFSRVWDTTPAEFRRVMDVTYLGQVHGAQTALSRMRSRDRGSIVFVGSALAKRGIPLQASYCAAKHATQGFFESLRAELLAEGSHVRICMVHLPALNTPQFRWVKSRMSHESQPVPPIFQPELAADAIVYASLHGRRELYVGAPTVKTIWGNRLVPWAADRYLAKNGISSQLTDEVREREDHNLWEPVEGDRGPHGPFAQRSRRRSVQWVLDKHRWGVGAAVVAVAGAGAAWLLGGVRVLTGG
jgi:NAD(P)-dependent dehydrogenase (short-subunit alcohol dehydrogenase family)